jgi:hypothetical protein
MIQTNHADAVPSSGQLLPDDGLLKLRSADDLDVTSICQYRVSVRSNQTDIESSTHLSFHGHSHKVMLAE